MLTRIWEQNKIFILKVGGGFAVFLIISSLISAYGEGAEKVLVRASRLESEIRKMKKTLAHRYGQEQTRLAAYEEQEVELLKALRLPPENEFASFDEKAPRVQFNQAISRVWGEARSMANRLGVAIPEKLGPGDFGIESGDSKEEYQRYYTELAVVGRALRALVEAEMVEIGRPELLATEEFEIPGSPGMLCVFHAAAYRVSGTYGSYVRLLKSVQQAGSHMQVRLMSLEGKRGSETLVRGDLTFACVDLTEAAELEESGTSKPPPRKKRGKRRP